MSKPMRFWIAGVLAAALLAPPDALGQGAKTSAITGADISALKPGSFIWAPQAAPSGPMVLVVSLKAQQAYVYRNGVRIGVSTVSWEDAAKRAVETAAKSLRDLRVAEIKELDVKIEDGKVVAYRARVSLSFKYEG